MAAYPTKDELKGFTTVQHVFDWVPLPEALQKTVLDTFGMEPNEPVRNFSSLPQDTFDSTLAALRLNEAPLLPVPRTKVVKAFEVCKMAAGETKHPETLEAEIAEQLTAQKEADKKSAELELQRINLERDKVATLKFQSEVQLKTISGSGVSTPSTAASSSGVPCTISLAEVLDQLSKEVAPLLSID